MKPLIKKTLRQGLRINQQAVNVANNAYDRLFRSDTLIKSDLTEKQEIHSNGLMSVNFYPPLHESCLLYTSPSPRDAHESRMPSSA